MALIDPYEFINNLRQKRAIERERSASLVIDLPTRTAQSTLTIAPPKPVNLVPRGGAEPNLAQRFLREGGALGVSAIERFSGARDRGQELVFTPTRRVERFLFGREPIRNVEDVGIEALRDFGASEKTALKFGGTAGVAILGLNLLPFGGATTKVVRGLKFARNIDDVARILTKSGVSDDLIKIYGKRFVNLRNTSQIGRELKILKDISKGKGTTGKLIAVLEDGALARSRAAQKGLRGAELSKRAADVERIGTKFPGEAGLRKQLGALKGKLPSVAGKTLRQPFTQAEIDSLFKMAHESKSLLPFQKLNARKALVRLFDGILPTDSEMALLREVFGTDLFNAIRKNRTGAEKFMAGLGEAINVPRAIMASFDLSAMFRQGIFFIGRPKRFTQAFASQFKLFFSEKSYEGLVATQKANKEMYEKAIRSKLALTDIHAASITGQEEAFMGGELASKIPGIGRGIKASNRAYSGALNKLRFDVFSDIVTKYERMGIKVKGVKIAGDELPQKFYDDVARFVNAGSGRGGLGALERAAVPLNALLFSPKLMASRLTLMNPVFYMRLSPGVRKEALVNLLTFGATAMTVAGILKLNGAEIGADPRSADFMKAKFGNTRYDFLGGFQQYIRMAAQLITGEIVSTTSGRTITLGEGFRALTRYEIFLRFFENKTSPITSFAIGLAKGTTAIGQDFDIPAEVINRFTPMVMQDMYDLYQEDGLTGLLESVPAIFGVGLQTYGKQELVSGSDSFGRPRSQVRPVQGLGEAAARSIRGRLGIEQRALEASRAFSVDAYVEQLKGMDRDVAIEIYDKLRESDPDLAEKIADNLVEKKEGVTPHHRDLRVKGVADGTRARAVLKDLEKLETREERIALWDEYVTRKIITEEVAEQLIILLSQ